VFCLLIYINDVEKRRISTHFSVNFILELNYIKGGQNISKWQQ